jgi:hypothetical protein
VFTWIVDRFHILNALAEVAEDAANLNASTIEAGKFVLHLWHT